MFDFEPAKILIVGAVALIVVGPKELPRVLRQAGQALGKMRRMATELQGQFMEALREADQDHLKKEISDISEAATFKNSFGGLRDAKQTIEAALAEPAKPAASEPVGWSGSGPDQSNMAAWEPPKIPPPDSFEMGEPPVAPTHAGAPLEESAQIEDSAPIQAQFPDPVQTTPPKTTDPVILGVSDSAFPPPIQVWEPPTIPPPAGYGHLAHSAPAIPDFVSGAALAHAQADQMSAAGVEATRISENNAKVNNDSDSRKQRAKRARAARQNAARFGRSS